MVLKEGGGERKVKGSYEMFENNVNLSPFFALTLYCGILTSFSSFRIFKCWELDNKKMLGIAITLIRIFLHQH